MVCLVGSSVAGGQHGSTVDLLKQSIVNRIGESPGCVFDFSFVFLLYLVCSEVQLPLFPPLL